MNLVVHLIPKRPLGEPAAVASVFGAQVGSGLSDLAKDIDDPDLGRLLQSGDSLGGLGVSLEWKLSDAETSEISHFSVACRQTVPESDAAYKRNHAMWSASPIVSTAACTSIRLPRDFHLSRVKLKPGTVAGIGEWTESYVAGADFWQCVQDFDLKGLIPTPVLKVGTRAAFPDIHQLFAETILPPAVATRSGVPAPDRGGLLRYSAGQLTSLPDFMQTAEPWANDRFGWPLWVVSARARHALGERRISGWSFLPVLVSDSAPHANYLDLCQKLQALLCSYQTCTLEPRVW